MNLLEMCNLYWWSINDSKTNPLLIDKTTLVMLINDARKELAGLVDVQKYSEFSVTSAMKFALPTDFITPILVKLDDSRVKPVDDISSVPDILDEDETGSANITYSIVHSNEATLNNYLQIFGETPSGSSKVKLWYKGYPTELANDTDVPTEIPPEYHKHLVLTYVRSLHEFKLGRYGAYQQLATLWEDIKKEVAGEHDARNKPVDNDGGFEY